MAIEACEPRQVDARPDSAAANLHQDAYKPGEHQNQVSPQTVPSEFPPLTIVNDQPPAAEAPRKIQQPSANVLDMPLRRFCNTPIPPIPLPLGLSQCEQEIKDRHDLGETALGGQVGLVKGVYNLGNGMIGLLNAGVSPAARLGDFLGNSIVNPQLAMHDAVSWGNDTGKALVGATQAYKTVANYSLAVSKAEWQGDFLKEPRDGVITALAAAAHFGKQSPAQQAESISEQGISIMLPIAAGKATSIVPQLAENAGKFFNGPVGLKLCPAGVPADAFFSNRVEPAGGGIYKMTGRGVVADYFAQSISSLRQELLGFDGKPLGERLKSLEQINRDLIKQEQIPITDRRQAHALGAGLKDVDSMFQRQALEVIKEVKTLKPQADEIGAKLKLTDAEEEFLNQYTEKESTAYQLVKDRLKEVYGWDEKASGMADKSFSDKDGIATQRRVNNEMSNLLNDGLDKNYTVKEILKAKGISPDRARGWVGMPMPEGSAADKAGCDYLLVNKGTGEMYAFDVTEKTITMRHGRIVDSILTDKNLVFDTSEKNIPLERKNTVIGAVPENIRDDMIYRLTDKEGLSEAAAKNRVKLAEQNQLAEVIAKTICQPSSLNIFETRLPSANPTSNPLVQVYELQKFQADLRQLGYDQWASRISAAIGYLQRK
jgi:hypothetical protein